MTEIQVAYIVIGLLLALFVLLGTMLSLGKWAFLISGYNTLSKEEKKQYDELSLCRFMGKLMFVIAFCVLLFLLSELLKIEILLHLGVFLLFASVIFAVIYTSTGNRFKVKK